MNHEVKTILEQIGLEQRLLLSGFGQKDPASIAAAIARIAKAAGSAYLLLTGQPIDESAVKLVEKLTEEDLPHAEETPASSDNPVSAQDEGRDSVQVSGGEGAAKVQQQEEAPPETPRRKRKPSVS